MRRPDRRSETQSASRAQGLPPLQPRRSRGRPSSARVSLAWGWRCRRKGLPLPLASANKHPAPDTLTISQRLSPSPRNAGTDTSLRPASRPVAPSWGFRTSGIGGQSPPTPLPPPPTLPVREALNRAEDGPRERGFLLGHGDIWERHGDFLKRLGALLLQTRGRHEVTVSAEVVAELSRDGFRRGSEALQLIRGLPLLDIDDQVRGVAEVFVRERVMPQPVTGDAIHVAACCVRGVDCILSWNVRHLANPSKSAHLRVVCARLGLIPPAILTPDNYFWEDQ